MQVEERPTESIKPYENNPRDNDAETGIQAWLGPVESWVPVQGYEGLYEISCYGRLRTVTKSRMAAAGYIVRGKRTHDGYHEYGLWRRPSYWHVKAHRLVALTFLGAPPFANAQVAHFDGDKLNNHISNLRWATARENEADKVRHGRQHAAKPGEQHHNAKLTVALVSEMRRAAFAGDKFTTIAQRFNVRPMTAYSAIVGDTWSIVTDPAPLQVGRRKAS